MIFYGSSLSTNFEIEEIVNIEINVSDKGLPVFEIYGLINKSIEESKKRIISSFESCGLNFPLKNITVNLSPADIVKEGTHFDLGIAATLLRYTNLLNFDEKTSIFFGELSLDGSIKSLKNILYLVLTAKYLGYKQIFIPSLNLTDVSHVSGVSITGLNNLKDLLSIENIEIPKKENVPIKLETLPLNFNKILGNSYNKKVLSYALSGSHHLLLSGFPGSGKSLLSKSAVELLPDLELDKAYEVAKIFSYLGLKREGLDFYRPPFRAPHSSSSYASIFGGVGKSITPGEISIAHNGILLLDEFPEFNKQVIEGLRAPLEDKYITLSRSKFKKVLKSDFILIATMNPCKCGYFNHYKVVCKCTPTEVNRYHNKISGPILDRLDIQIQFDGKINRGLVNEQENYSYEEFYKLKKNIFETKTQLEVSLADKNINKESVYLDKDFVHRNTTANSMNILFSLQEKYSMSNRRYFKVLKLSNTISIFNKESKISEESILEALALTGSKM